MKKFNVHYSFYLSDSIDIEANTEEEAESFAMSRGRSLLYDKCLDGVDDEWHWDGNINIEGVETV